MSVKWEVPGHPNQVATKASPAQIRMGRSVNLAVKSVLAVVCHGRVG